MHARRLHSNLIYTRRTSTIRTDGTMTRFRKRPLLILLAVGLPVVIFNFRANEKIKLSFPRLPDVSKVPGTNYIFRVLFEDPEVRITPLALTTPKPLPLCPEVPENLATSYDPVIRLKELEAQNSSILATVQRGGTYKPRDCQSRERLAIVVPYRDRPQHLRSFLPFMHRLLQLQKLHYTIFIAEMTNRSTFNTGLLQNVGFALADRTDNFTCFIIHDVDLLPYNETNMYTCEDVPKHMVYINTKYGTEKIIYPLYFGGAVAVRREHFIKANGFSNLYFGWGCQDDDFQKRLKYASYSWERVPKQQGYYYAMPHRADKGNPLDKHRRRLLMNTKRIIGFDGLNSLNFTQKAFELRDLYTWVLVDVDHLAVIKNFTSRMPFLNATL